MSTAVHDPARSAAYGLAWEGIPDATGLLNPPFGGSRTVWVERHLALATADLAREEVGADGACLRLQGGGRADIRRTSMRTVLTMPRQVPDDELLHPFLATSAAVFSRWLGRDAFHAGGLVVAGGVWGVAGDKGAGKSTLLAWAAVNGVAVLADDLLVVEDGHVLVGPRCIDLRPDAAAHLGVGEDLGLVGSRHRWRLVVADPPEGPLPLRGWIHPTWGDDVRLEALPVAARVPALLAHLSLRLPPLDPGHILDLAALPAMRFSRPRAWDTLDRSGTQLLDRLAQA